MVEKSNKARKEEIVTREFTINLHKRLHGWYFIFLHFCICRIFIVDGWFLWNLILCYVCAILFFYLIEWLFRGFCEVKGWFAQINNFLLKWTWESCVSVIHFNPEFHYFPGEVPLFLQEKIRSQYLAPYFCF